MLGSAVKTLGMASWLRSANHRSRGVRAAAISTLALAIGVPIGALVALLGPILGSAAVVALAAAYLVLRSPLLALMAVIAVIFALPFAALPIDLGFAPTFLDLALLAAYLVWLSRTALHKDRDIITAPPLGGVLIFATLAVFSFIVGLSHAPLTSSVLRRFAELVLAILSFWLVLNIVRSRHQLIIAANALVVGGSVAGLAGVGLYVLPKTIALRALNALTILRYPGGDVLRYIEDDPEQALRAIGTSVDPNVLGGVLIFTAVLGAALLLASETSLPRWLLGSMVAITVLCLILTLSRSAFVGLAAGLGLLALLRYRKLVWLGLAVLAVLLLLPPMQAFVARLIEGLQGEDLAMKMRFGEYKDALILIRRHPWIGVGFSGTPEIDTYLGVSSVYLLIAEEMGIIGVAAFVLTMGAFLLRFLARRHALQNDPLVEAICYGAALAVFGGLVAGIADHYLFNLVFPHAATLLWMTMGLGVAALRIAHLPASSTPAEADDRRHWIIRAFLPDTPGASRGAWAMKEWTR